MTNQLAELYFNYNSDEDFNNEVGHKIADIVFKKCNYDFDKLHTWVFLNKHKKILEELSQTSL